MQVGDDVMVYLLKFSSIFLPIPRQKHHQVAGPPINDLCHKSSKVTAKSQCLWFGNQLLNIIFHTPLVMGSFYHVFNFCQDPKRRGKELILLIKY